MPSKNTIKNYVESGLYHVYNRGVEKRDVFLDDQDYTVFLSLLKMYLSPQEVPFTHPLAELPNLKPSRLRPLKSFFGEVELFAYCLLPNHFHFLIKQNTKDGMQKLMQALLTNYSTYFNKKYERVGPLFQGPYKAVLIETEPYLLHLSRYIHLNPPVTGRGLVTYAYSSYPYYLGYKNAIWIKPDEILAFFKTAQSISLRDCLSYQSFIENYQKDSGEILGDLVIEKD